MTRNQRVRTWNKAELSELVSIVNGMKENLPNEYAKVDFYINDNLLQLKSYLHENRDRMTFKNKCAWLRLVNDFYKTTHLNIHSIKEPLVLQEFIAYVDLITETAGAISDYIICHTDKIYKDFRRLKHGFYNNFVTWSISKSPIDWLIFVQNDCKDKYRYLTAFDIEQEPYVKANIAFYAPSSFTLTKSTREALYYHYGL